MEKAYILRFINKMALLYVLLILIFLFNSSCTSLMGRKYTLKDTVKFTGGLLAAWAVHEGGHYGMAKLQGDDPKFGWYKVSVPHDQHDEWNSMSGLTANAIAGELIMDLTPSKEKRDPFWTGLLWGSMFEEFTYPVFRGNMGDFSHDWHNETAFRIGFTTHSLTLLYREFFKKDKNDSAIKTPYIPAL